LYLKIWGCGMSEQKTIAVIGATGQQGGGLAQAILEHGEFKLRAITRKPDSDKARTLREAGADVVVADIDAVESLVSAFEGAHGAFVVTNFWEHFSPEKEKQQIRNLAEAVQRAKVEHVVWSTLEDTRLDVPLSDDRMPTLQDHYKVPHFDAKGESDKEFTQRGVPVTFLRASFYWDNFIYFGSGPKRAEDGILNLVLPMGDKKLAGTAAVDIGGVAYGIFKRGTSMIGEVVGVAGEHLTCEEIAAKMSKALGEPVRYVDVAPAVFRSFGFPGAEDLGNMFQYYQEFETKLAEVRSVERSRELHPGLLSFDQWLAQHAHEMPIEQPA
jgi:uncharacterized protein YbjT (DUF2867 family)